MLSRFHLIGPTSRPSQRRSDVHFTSTSRGRTKSRRRSRGSRPSRPASGIAPPAAASASAPRRSPPSTILRACRFVAENEADESSWESWFAATTRSAPLTYEALAADPRTTRPDPDRAGQDPAIANSISPAPANCPTPKAGLGRALSAMAVTRLHQYAAAAARNTACGANLIDNGSIAVLAIGDTEVGRETPDCRWCRSGRLPAGRWRRAGSNSRPRGYGPSL